MTSRRELTLPDLEIDEGPITVSLWLVERGAAVAQGDPVLEVLAGAAVIDLPAPVDGILAERLVAEDDSIEVGQVLAVFQRDEDRSPENR